MTATAATGRGVASSVCEHSLAHARTRGYRAIQFNFVVSTNERPVKLWQKLGFDVVGKLPGAFNHPGLGFVDAFVRCIAKSEKTGMRCVGPALETPISASLSLGQPTGSRRQCSALARLPRLLPDVAMNE